MDVPFVDLAANYRRVEDEIDAAMDTVIDDTRFIGGEPVETFEQRFADFIGVDEGVGVASGTDAIFLGLKALGVGSGDEVITVSHTFVSTVDGIVHNDARPRFVDIDHSTYTMDPNQLEEAITDDTAAIMPVHLYGHPADIDPILEIANENDLHVLEDACQAHGALYKGERVGGFGDLSCFSFYPSKNLGAFGDAGFVATDDSRLANRIRMLREYGEFEKYEHRLVGYNSRMDSLQAAVLNAKLPELDLWNEDRRSVAGTYNEAFTKLPLQEPTVAEDAEPVYHLYVVRTNSERERDALRDHLSDRGISTGIHYPVPVHRQPSYKDMEWEFDELPVTEEVASRILSLPMYPELSKNKLFTVIDAVESFYSESR